MQNHEADALLNMELEQRLQERVRDIVLTDKHLTYAIGRMLSMDAGFLNACKANYEQYRMDGRL